MENTKFKHVFAIIYTALIILFTIYVVLDTFVIERDYIKVENINNENYVYDKLDIAEYTATSTSYIDENIKIEISEYFEYDTQIYVADVVLADSMYLKCAFAKNTYGKNVTQKTSVISQSCNAILSINGDYYGVREAGYVLKNGVLYRDESAYGQQDLVIYKDGTFSIILEDDISAKDLLSMRSI